MIKLLFLTLLSSNLAELIEARRYYVDSRIDPLSDEMVDAINSLNTTWKAKKNFLTLEYLKGGVILDDTLLDEDEDIESVNNIQIDEVIPESFDAREKWANCSSISYIRDQGACGSCWAFAAVGTMSDRICIQSQGEIQVDLSAQDLVDCCANCAELNKEPCSGGKIRNAWVHWKEHGIVTGGYGGGGCKRYKFPPCKHTNTTDLSVPMCTNAGPYHPKCEKTCQPGYDKAYNEDIYKGGKHGPIGNMKKIQIEIMRNGPVQSSFRLYSDFPSYSSGVYQRHSSNYRLNHAIRIVGWGIENGVDYWLVANSWNTYWGDQGYFKIRRGYDECDIESNAYTGVPEPKL